MHSKKPNRLRTFFGIAMTSVVAIGIFAAIANALPTAIMAGKIFLYGGNILFAGLYLRFKAAEILQGVVFFIGALAFLFVLQVLGFLK